MAAMLRAPFRVATVSHCKDLLSIAWQDGKQSNFPNIWLRSAVRDPKFFDSNGLLYKQSPYVQFIAQETPLLSAEHEKGSEDVLVQWEDHLGNFNASWLRAQDHSINEDLCKKPNTTLWDANFKLPVYEYLERKEKFQTWFDDLRKYGLAIFQGVPPNERGLMGILHSVGQESQRIHPTNVLSVALDAKKESNYDYDIFTSDAHPVHIDTAYYDTPFRLSCLMCSSYKAPVRDTYNFFVDNLKVIEDIRREEPEAYELLRTIPVRLARRRLTLPELCDPADVYKYHYDNVEMRPVISFDQREKHHWLYISNKHAGVDLSSFKDHSTMKKHYEAYQLLNTKLNDPANHQQLIMKQGFAVIFNNGRVSHGRGPIHASTDRGMLLGFNSQIMWNTRWRILNGQKSGLEEKWLYGCSAEQLEILADRKGE